MGRSYGAKISIQKTYGQKTIDYWPGMSTQPMVLLRGKVLARVGLWYNFKTALTGAEQARGWHVSYVEENRIL